MLQVLQRLAWLCLFPVALALVIAAGALMVNTHQQQVASVQGRVNAMAAKVDTNLALHMHGLKALAATAAAPNKTRSLPYLHAEAVSYEQTMGPPVALADAERHILLSSARPLGQPLPMLPNAGGPSALDRALQTGKPQVTDVVDGTISRRPVVAVVVPAPWAPDTKAWIASLSTDLMQRRLNQEYIASGWNEVLLDGNGKVVVARGPDVHTSAPPSYGVVSFSAPVNDARWTAVAYASAWTFYQPQIRMGAGLLVLLSMAGVTTMWLVRRSSQRINGAVLQLTDSGEELSETTQRPVAPLRITEIEEVHQELRRLRVAEHMAEDQERQRVARELHDGLQQQLARVKIMVNLAARRPDQSSDSVELLQRVSEVTQQAIDELHQIVNALRPHVLDQCGLFEAVQQLSENTSRSTGLLIEVEYLGDASALVSLPAPLLGCAFRVIQESLNNVRKHARATFVHVVIDKSRPGHLAVRVSDDGIGFFEAWPVQSDTSFGLISMRQRVTALGGTFRVSQGQPDDPACGTTVFAAIPIPGSSG